MGPRTLWKRAAALLAAAGLLATLSASVSADENNIGSEAARALQPTEVVAEIPEAYNEIFELQWGGGSLYQLKGRLATMGCMVNNIWLYDDNKWNVYNQYDLPQDTFFIQQFIQHYEQFIPAATLWANCYNICEFGDGQCLTFDELREQEGNFEEYFARERQFLQVEFTIDENTICTQEFHPTIEKRILPLLPIRPDTCVVRQEKISSPDSIGGTGGYVWTESINAPPFFVFYDTSSLWYREYQRYEDLALHTEIHELCHMNQNWQQIQGLTTEQGFNEDIYTWFKSTPQGKEFIEMTGFIDLEYWQWDLPRDSIYRNIYSRDPIELSAELCTMYLIDKLWATQRYNYEKWVATGRAYNGYFAPRITPLSGFNTSKYLNPEVVEWLEAYMILPDISE